MENSKKTILTVLALLILTGGLIYIDYSGNQSTTSQSFASNILKSWFQPRGINSEIIGETSLKGSEINPLPRTNEFFSPYLTLPKNITADRYTITGSSILVYEVQKQNSFKIIASLLSQESSRYQFNQINAGTFYLNQLPTNQKTHNFLGISIGNTLYGFQYEPLEHKKVLELVDALQKTE